LSLFIFHIDLFVNLSLCSKWIQGAQAMVKSLLSILLSISLLLAGLPFRVLAAEETKQRIVAVPAATFKTLKAGCTSDSQAVRAGKKIAAVPGGKQISTHRKWYIYAGITVAAGIVSYYRLQPDSPFDHRR
jgi:hypothetical protein